MRRLLKTKPKLSLILLTILFLESCASLPKPPKGELCDLDVVNGLAICTDITGAVTDQSHAKPVTRPLKDLDNGIGMSSGTWQSIQVYIRETKNSASQCD